MNFERKQIIIIYDHDPSELPTLEYIRTYVTQVAAHNTAWCKKELVKSHTISSRISHGSEIRCISCLIKWLHGTWYSIAKT